VGLREGKLAVGLHEGKLTSNIGQIISSCYGRHWSREMETRRQTLLWSL